MKKTHAEVRYRQARTQEKRCGTCSMFSAAEYTPSERKYEPAHCTDVEDPISRAGLCDIWDRRKP